MRGKPKRGDILCRMNRGYECGVYLGTKIRHKGVGWCYHVAVGEMTMGFYVKEVVCFGIWTFAGPVPDKERSE